MIENYFYPGRGMLLATGRLRVSGLTSIVAGVGTAGYGHFLNVLDKTQAGLQQTVGMRPLPEEELYQVWL